MKITHNKLGQNLNTTDTTKADVSKSVEKSSARQVDADKSKTAATATPAQVNISDRAQEMKKIKELAMAAPDVNEAKVDRLQKLIDSGKYKVDAKDIADKMVDEHLNWQ
jgi:negative regulator of flagellin synthesis FlgM